MGKETGRWIERQTNTTRDVGPGQILVWLLREELGVVDG